MESSHIKKIDKDYMNHIGLTKEQIDKVEKLINYAIKEKLYTHTMIPYHHLDHIERTLIYALWIANKQSLSLTNDNILLYAALFHDAARSKGASNQTHGIKGAQIAKEKLNGILDNKTIEAIGLLIETHASKNDNVSFKNTNFSLEEQNYIQKLSNVLKDADALDRNRIKLFPFLKCNIKYLRFDESKAILSETDVFLKKYKKYK